GKRMVVNCGYNDSHSENWRHITRETAAHSTLIIDDCSAGEIATNGTKYRAFGPVITRGVDATQVNRKEQDGDIWIEASHEGYRAATGLIHRRRLYMVDGGYDVRGEDSLSVPMGAAPMFKGAQFPFTIRFHLHPDVRATLSRDGKSALIILPGGEGWRFRTDSGALKLERSIYLARANKPEPCEQIIIHGSALSDNNGDDKSNRVRWSFRRVPTEV
ncbi:MAG: heparinase II/III-family protein, partial [Robiginitomaculum sp.]